MITLISPAKINLFLQILHRRDDGFHQLATLMQTVDLFDILHFSLANQDELTCDDRSLPTDTNNLVLKAASLYRRLSGIPLYVKVKLEKKIPYEAGLGGGSSNAATTLWAMNQLAGQPLTNDQLMVGSAQIGSDIPFFFSQGTAYCSGRGEVVQSFKSKSYGPVTIVKPPEGLSTQAIYKSLNLDQLIKRDTDLVLEAFQEAKPVFFNDLEKPAFACLPKLAQLKEELEETGFETVLMSGSGSAFFCLGEKHKSLPDNVYSVSTRFLNRQANSWYTL